MNLQKILKLNDKVYEIFNKSEKDLKDIFKKVDDIALLNQAKVLKSFQDNKVSLMHFNSSTGYGYGDVGREVIEKIYADIFNMEDSLVRVQFVNGTHAISTALYANLKTNDELIYISGEPYDTIHQTIGISENSQSLINNGVKFKVFDLVNDKYFDEENILKYIKQNKVKMIAIQRSKGYSSRESLSVDSINDITNKIKEVDKDIIVMVDNCYGEFVEINEPTVDICCGSLIKNIGGSLCATGGYIVGKERYIKDCSERLTCPGIGKECGATLNQNKNILQGLFIAPMIVANALKTAIFASYMLEKLGFNVFPKYNEDRHDIVQSVIFKKEEELIKFIQGIQSASPVDSHVLPVPWDMPGYDDQVIMAAGTFIEGASIELSADAPIKEPYIAYLQGGITFESGKLAILNSIMNMLGDQK